MSKSAADILRELVGVVRRVERDAADIASRAGGVAAVLERMSQLQPRREPGPGQAKGSPPVAAPGPS